VSDRPIDPTDQTDPADPLDPTTAHLDPQVFVTYLEKTRWFGGKGRPFAVSDVRRLGTLGDTGPYPRVVLLLVELTYDDAPAGTPAATELYQVPLALYRDAEHRLDRAFIGWWEEPDLGWVHAYDALHDRQAMALWLEAFGAATDGAPRVVGDLEFHRVPGHELDLTGTSALFTGEQSNSSVAFGEDSMMKVFRKINPGANPDVVTHEALTRAGSEHVAALYGWIERPDPEGGEPLHLAMLQQFLRTATDGWDLALGSVRNLLADDDLAARESGGDFAGEASRLGEALREVHAGLREARPVDPADAPEPAAIAEAMTQRLEAALAVAPELEPHAGSLRAAYDRLGALPAVEVQQVHGDLHLGQTLRTALGWKIVDFEGEPAKTLAERLLPDSPWRDVAGMLRSFDYAPHVVERTHGDPDQAGDEAADRRRRGAEWADRNQRYFLGAYVGITDGSPLTEDQQTLVDAYVADKAVYEVVYETRNRPTWVEIPLSAIATIGAR